MKLLTSSFIVNGHDKITHHVVHVHVVMAPAETQPQTGDVGLDIRYKVRARTLSPIVYWFMVKVLKYEVR